MVSRVDKTEKRREHLTPVYLDLSISPCYNLVPIHALSPAPSLLTLHANKKKPECLGTRLPVCVSLFCTIKYTCVATCMFSTTAWCGVICTAVMLLSWLLYKHMTVNYSKAVMALSSFLHTLSDLGTGRGGEGTCLCGCDCICRLRTIDHALHASDSRRWLQHRCGRRLQQAGRDKVS